MYNFPSAQIMFNVEAFEMHDEMTEETRTVYKYDYVEVDDINDTDRIISAIVRSRYTQDDVEAIIANHLVSDSTDFDDFQTWRRVAKIVARKKIYDKNEIDKWL